MYDIRANVYGFCVPQVYERVSDGKVWAVGVAGSVRDKVVLTAGVDAFLREWGLIEPDFCKAGEC